VRRSSILVPSSKPDLHPVAMLALLTRADNLLPQLWAIHGMERVILHLLFRQLCSTLSRRPGSALRTSLPLIKEALRLLNPLEVRWALLPARTNADEAPDSAHYHRRTASEFGSAGRRIMLLLVWEDYRKRALRHRRIKSHGSAMLDARPRLRRSRLLRPRTEIPLTYGEHMTSHIFLPLRPPLRFSPLPVAMAPMLLNLHQIPVIIALRLWPTRSYGALRKGGQEWTILLRPKHCASWMALAAEVCGLALLSSASTARAAVALALLVINRKEVNGRA